MRLMLVGGVVAAAVGGGATPAIAASVAARSGELVAREAPGTSQAGIAVLRGNDRVRLLGERDDWSEILLPDGRRAWVPTAEVTRIEEPPRVRESPRATATPGPAETAAPDARHGEDLGAEIARLRTIVDELARRRPEEPAPRASPIDDATSIIAGVALIVGILLGSAWERRRSRRDRSLRF